MAHAEIRCPHCSASGRVDNETNSPFMMGRCPVCGGYVVYFCGASLPLDDSVIDSHSLTVIRDHILGRIDEFLEERLTDFLQEYAEEFEIARVPSFEQEQIDDDDDSHLGDEPHEPGSQEQEYDVEASAEQREADAITDAEVADFLRIDLQLIDQAQYFNRYFGS